jgi:hypothetical protein
VTLGSGMGGIHRQLVALDRFESLEVPPMFAWRNLQKEKETGI